MIAFYLIAFCSLRVAQSDVSHLHNLLYNNIDHVYGLQPVFISTTVKPFLPEIIVNHASDHGYHYDRPDIAYIPPAPPSFPPAADPPINVYLPPPNIPLADPPNQGYLPPEHINENYDGIDAAQHDNVIINYQTSTLKNHKSTGFPGYDYDRPTTIPSTQPSPIFIPQADYTDNSGGYVYGPQNDPSEGYLPPVTERLAKGFDVLNSYEKNPIQLQISEMRCVPNQGGFFKAVFSLQSAISAIPTVDSDIIDNRCDLRLIRSQVVINIAAEDFQRCGVVYCGQSLCLRIRFPQIGGMKTGSDSILTLQCKIQDRVVSKTHALKVGISNEHQARSTGAFAQGGSQQPFRTYMELLKKTTNGFTKHLEPKGIVQLGEELQLRAHVRAGDGWNFTRLADVNLQRVSPSGEIINSAALVNPSGCINPTMRSISPAAPIFEPPLGYRLNFKAVMFQGMRSGDELLMSVKLVGCMDQRDCYVNTLSCDRNALSSGRFRRNVGDKNITELSETSTISFRVEAPQVKQAVPGPHTNTAHIVVGGVLALICFISLLAVIAYVKFSKKL